MKGIRAQNTIIISCEGHCRAMEKIFLFPAHLGFCTLPEQCSHPLPAQRARDQICASGITVQSANYRTTIKHLLPCITVIPWHAQMQHLRAQRMALEANPGAQSMSGPPGSVLGPRWREAEEQGRGHQPLLHSLSVRVSPGRALHSQKRSSKALEAATSPFPKQGQLPEREVGLCWGMHRKQTFLSEPKVTQNWLFVGHCGASPCQGMSQRGLVWISLPQATTFPRDPTARHSLFYCTDVNNRMSLHQK